MQRSKAFSLIELIVVIVILGTLAIVAFPKFVNLSKEAKKQTLENIGGQISSMITLAQAKARVEGLSPVNTNPGGPGGAQLQYIVDFGFGSVEVDFRNLCPESRGEGGDQLNMTDFLSYSQDLQTKIGNRYTGIGFEVPAIPSSQTPTPATDEGCYVLYDSFGLPNCTVTVVTDDC